MNFKPISVIQLQKIKEAIAEKYNLVKPTYTVALAGGGKQVFDYDTESINDAKTPKTDKDKWNEYQLAFDAMQNEINEKAMAYVFYEGIECEIDNEWLELQEWLGIALPSNKFDLKVRYVTTELLRTPQEIRSAMVEIMRISVKGVDDSAIKAAEGSFPGNLQEK